jgi:plastocyanin
VARKLILLTAIIVPLTFAACGDDEDEGETAASGDTTAAEETTAEDTTTGGASDGGETVAISETDFAIDPADVETAPGSVTFDITNDGQTVHNLEVEGSGVEEVSDDIGPGESTQLTVDLGAGEYEMYCAIGNHRDLGMDGTINVSG